MLTASPPLDRLTWTWQGYPIQYTVMGSGQPLLLIHGFGASIGHWRQNIPVLAEAGYQVWAIDLLGFGGSGKPPIAYSLSVWQEMLKDFWQQHMQKPTIFVGNSIGGLLSLMMVADHPDLAAGAILLNCAGGLNHRADELNPFLALIMASFTRLVATPIIGEWLFEQIRQKSRIRSTLQQVYCHPAAITDELVDLLYQPACDVGAQKVFASILTAPAGPRPEELLPKLRHPLLVLWGEGDPWTPIQRGKTFEQYVSNLDYQFIGIPETGHCPHDERPELVNRLMLDWLDQRFSRQN
ncbi:MAG: alpha/beta fold hydrolase [Cyanobacteriota bacterium]|nr:alpha/beta fold hydrolase [Cyanobacteriota bacterium]